MLIEFQRDRIHVVLVSPRNPLNIGAAARAMANFGFRRLAVAAPYEPHWREARSAVGAPDLLANAGQTATFAETVPDCTLVIGTATLARRKPELPVVCLPDLAPIVRNELRRGGQVALVFGSEKRGLTVEDLSHCHLLVEIPTDPLQPSMNLGQAVAVCLYEIASRTGETGTLGQDTAPPEQPRRTKEPPAHSHGPAKDIPATTDELELLAGIVDKTMLAANYSPSIMRKANRHDTRVLLHRLTLTQRDARRILGLFRRILWRLEHDTGDSNHSPTSVPHK